VVFRNRRPGFPSEETGLRGAGGAVTRIVFITQQVDPQHPLLGATVSMVQALAERTSEVVVLADRVDRSALTPNTRYRLFAGRTKVARAVRFGTALVRELARSPKPAAIVAHMCPIYAVLAAPAARVRGVPVFLWYAHWHSGRLLQLAERLSTRIITVHPSSFPVASNKLEAIGHSIDVREFPCVSPASANGSVRALALGRYSPAKGLATILRGVRLAVDRGVDAHLTVCGPAGNTVERRERVQLQSLVRELQLADRITLNGVVPRSTLPAVFSKHDVLVNNMRPGAPDKVVYEAAAACLPVIASNPAFDGFLDGGSRFAHDDAAAFSDRLVAFAGLGSEGRKELGRTLRRRVVDGHSVDRWAERIIELANAR
jgi:glycosyltransferase involved in cell wall biosynthesis